MNVCLNFLKSAKRFGSKSAFIDGVSGAKISYKKALIAVLLLRKRFKSYKGKNVGMMIPVSGGAMITMLALLACGKTPVMINYTTGIRRNCDYAKSKCGIKKVITAKGLLSKLGVKKSQEMVLIEDMFKQFSVFAKLKAALLSKLPYGILKSLFVKVDEEKDNIVLLFTSGSENRPKVVPITNKNVEGQILGTIKCYDISQKDRFLASLPLFHVFGFQGNFCIPLYLGATIITLSNPLDYKLTCNAIKEYKATFMMGTPTFYAAYLRKCSSDTFRSVKVAICGADRLPKELHQRYLEEHNLFLIEGYGTTETSPILTNNRFEDYRLGSVGKAFPGVKIRIVDTESGEDLPAGSTGKILVQGDNVMKGYYHDVENTDLHFRYGWYDTGDMGCLDEEGFLWLKGRLRRFVKIGGEMVSLVAIESVLSEFFKDEEILFCVVDIPNEKKGAEVVLATTAKIDKIKMKKWVKENLNEISVPKTVFVLKRIPLLGSGKVDFRKVERVCRIFSQKRTILGQLADEMGVNV